MDTLLDTLTFTAGTMGLSNPWLWKCPCGHEHDVRSHICTNSDHLVPFSCPCGRSLLFQFESRAWRIYEHTE